MISAVQCYQCSGWESVREIWGVFDERSDNWKKKVKTKSEVRREKRNGMFWRVGQEINEKKKNQLKTKGGESKEREKKERSRIQVETFLFVKITYWANSSEFSGNWGEQAMR